MARLEHRIADERRSRFLNRFDTEFTLCNDGQIDVSEQLCNLIDLALVATREYDPFARISSDIAMLRKWRRFVPR